MKFLNLWDEVFELTASQENLYGMHSVNSILNH